jgi:hypothetical protein
MQGKKSIWTSRPYIIIAIIISFIISSIFYNNNNYDKNSNKKHVFQSIMLFLFVFILINMLTRDAGMTL